MIDRYAFTLPYPPSANKYWRAVPKVGVLLSREARAYKALVAKMCAGLRPLEGDLELTLDVYRPRKAGDLSNRIKVLEDALQGLAFEDDSQIVRIHAYRHDDKDRPRVEVCIVPAGES